VTRNRGTAGEGRITYKKRNRSLKHADKHDDGWAACAEGLRVWTNKGGESKLNREQRTEHRHRGNLVSSHEMNQRTSERKVRVEVQTKEEPTYGRE